MGYYFKRFLKADPKTKAFILTVTYLFLLILWSAVWPYYHLTVYRTQIPKTTHTQLEKVEY